MCSCHSILECCVMFSGVKLSIRSFVLFAFIESAYETKFFIFSYEGVQKIWKTAVYHFSTSYLVLELKSFEDAKVKAKSMDTKHVILCDVTYIE